MKRCWYTALAQDGAVVRGTAEYAGLDELIDELASEGLQLVGVRWLPAWTGRGLGLLAPGAVAEFCYLVAQYLGAGAGLRQALQDAAASSSVGRLRLLAGRLRRQVERGDSFGEALGRSGAFPALVVHLARIGEETGRLAETMASAARQYEQLQMLRSALRRALIYPVFALAAILGSGLFWLVVVVPRLATLFETMMPELPASTRSVLTASRWLESSWPMVVAGVVLAVGCLPLLLRWRVCRPAIERLLWSVPGLRSLERTRTYQALFSAMAAMQSAGLPLTRSLAVLAEQAPNTVLRHRLGQVQAATRAGEPLHAALDRTGHFERFALSLVRLGEATGSLDVQCRRLADHYGQQLRGLTEAAARLFEPVVLLVLAILLLTIGVTVIGPVYDMASRSAGAL